MNINEIIEKYNLYKITAFEADGFEPFIPDNGFLRYDMNSRGIRIWDKITDEAQYHIRERFRQNRIEYCVTYNITEMNHGIVTNRKDPVEKLMTERFFSMGYKINRDDGPAVLRLKKDGKIFKAEWWKDNIDITDDVEQWIKDNGLPSLTKWTDDHFAAYKHVFFNTGGN